MYDLNRLGDLNDAWLKDGQVSDTKSSMAVLQERKYTEVIQSTYGWRELAEKDWRDKLDMIMKLRTKHVKKEFALFLKTIGANDGRVNHGIRFTFQEDHFNVNRAREMKIIEGKQATNKGDLIQGCGSGSKSSEQQIWEIFRWQN